MSQKATGTPATGAERFIESVKALSLSLGLRALNDIYIILEDKMEQYEGTLIIPDAYEFFAKKFPCTGTILSMGAKTRFGLKVGERVVFARLGVQRYKVNGVDLCDVREADLHGTIN